MAKADKVYVLFGSTAEYGDKLISIYEKEDDAYRVAEKLNIKYKGVVYRVEECQVLKGQENV